MMFASPNRYGSRPGPWSTAVFVSLLVLLAVAPLTAQAKEPGRVAAQVDGQPLYAEEMNSADLYAARKQVYALEMAALRHQALEVLRAKRPGQFPAPRVRVSDKEVETFYQKANLRQRGSLADFKDSIREYITAQKTAQAEQEQFNQAVAQGLIQPRLAPPPPFLFRIKQVKGAASRGPQNARVVLVEFSDFQCPFCLRVQPTLTALLNNNPKTVRLEYRHMPLDNLHDEARRAAQATECAGEQGVFWAYHDQLYQSPRDLNDQKLMALAEKSGVKDRKAFSTCLNSGRYAKRVAEDEKAAASLGITGTPGFLVAREKGEWLEGVVLSGAMPLENFQEAVDDMAR
ncbi:MAG: DsbA family protein [Deltaproteobacteria bacterium]|nr:DsbA family protein [Deltaproteobacteria bacterium]